MAKSDRVHGPYLRGTKWRIIVVGSDGARRYRSFKSKRAAEEYREVAEEELAAVAGITIADAIEKYETYHRVTKKNEPRSTESTMLALRRMFRDGGMLMSDLRTPEQGEKLYEDLQSYRKKSKLPQDQWEAYAVDTHRNTLSESKTFLRWCVKKKFCLVNVLEKVEGEGARLKGKDKSRLTFDEARVFMDMAVNAAADGDEGALAGLVALLLAIRATEVVRIAVRDIDLGGTLLHVMKAKTKAGEISRQIPNVLQPLMRLAAAGKDRQAYLFGDGKKPRGRCWVRKNVQRLCRIAKIPEVTAHALKRTHATLAAEAGATGAVLARSLGHESFNVSQESYIKRGTTDARRRKHLLEVLEGGLDRHGPRSSPDDMSPLVSASRPKE